MADIHDLLRSHDELRRRSLIVAGKRIRQLQFGRKRDPVLTLLRRTLRDARVVRNAFGAAKKRPTQI